MTRVFLDGIGFRDAGLHLSQPVALKGSSGRAVTVTQLVSTPESSVLVYEVEWHGEQDITHSPTAWCCTARRPTPPAGRVG